MSQKGSEQYKQAQKLANEIKDMAGTDIAETVDKTMNPYGKKVAFISDKQSWILAVAAVENNITL